MAAVRSRAAATAHHWSLTPSPHHTCCAFLLLQVLTGGFFALQLPAWIAWLKWLSYIYYALQARLGSTLPAWWGGDMQLQALAAQPWRHPLRTMRGLWDGNKPLTPRACPCLDPPSRSCCSSSSTEAAASCTRAPTPPQRTPAPSPAQTTPKPRPAARPSTSGWLLDGSNGGQTCRLAANAAKAATSNWLLAYPQIVKQRPRLILLLPRPLPCPLQHPGEPGPAAGPLQPGRRHPQRPCAAGHAGPLPSARLPGAAPQNLQHLGH